MEQATEVIKTHEPAAGCASCSTSTCGVKTTFGGIKPADAVIALLGNPNVGKSTVFNALTGLRQHVGNWPGKTVARAEGRFRLGKSICTIVDLPGAYSLFSSSHHEEIARDFVLFGQPDVTIVVVDATRLERNLILVLQTLEITDRVVVALNLMDEAERHGLKIDVRGLARRLGVPVVPMAARQGEGIKDLLTAVDDVVSGRLEPHVSATTYEDKQLESGVKTLVGKLRGLFPSLPNPRWVAMRLLDNDHSIVQAIREGTLGNVEAMEKRVMPSLNTRELVEEG